MTCAVPFSEYMTFHWNLIVSLGPSGHFLSYKQIIQLWQLFLSSLSDPSLLLFPSYLGCSGRETGTAFPDSATCRNQHSTMTHRVELQLPCCSLYPKHRCSIPELWGHIIFPTHMQLKMTQICSNCITTFPFNKESIFYWWKWIFLSGKLDKVSLISHLFNPNRILGATT